jgi:hypothetical protein
MAGSKNFFATVLGPGDEKVFRNNISWFTVGLETPSLTDGFEIHGLDEDITGFTTQFGGSITSPENCQMVSEAGNEIKIVALAGNVSNVNVFYRY